MLPGETMIGEAEDRPVGVPRLDSTLFTWGAWRAGSIHDLDVACREVEILSPRGRGVLRAHVIGWCPAEALPCRAKEGEIAVMCFKGGEQFWFHLRRREFEGVFGRVG
jgi:hypothetical protein